MILTIIYTILLMLSPTDPVQWQFELSNQGKDLVFEAKATIDSPWVLYGIKAYEEGPIPFSISFDNGIDVLSDIEESANKEVVYDALFDIDVEKFKNNATFKQHIDKHEGVDKIKGSIRYMTCDGNRCLPPKTVDFEIAIK